MAKNDLPRVTSAGKVISEKDLFFRLVKLHLQCDEEEKIVGKCPVCGGNVRGFRYTDGEFEGHGEISCENCGVLLMR